MIVQRKIELLAPAKNVECGIEAVNHGADAVYIGAARFGARSAAGNSLSDIARLVEYAHRFRVKVYVTVNTLLRDDELSDTEALIWDLYRVGVDALIVQDFALLSLALPPIPLHASTQMDNRTPAKVKWLQSLGFQQTVLARELSLAQIADIHRAVPSMPLEVFVHGALCVSYSGRCYVSQHAFGRSANRGECAQFCRLKFDLQDADGRLIESGKHLLSLRDMNRSNDLEQLLDAGASSFKIEGRLKDVNYVKNITAYYRAKLDEIFRRRKEYIRASSGTSEIAFTPAPEKSFNRGFTHYYLDGHRSPNVASPFTPKSMGERVGVVKDVRGNCLVVAGVASFAAGDGLCYLDEAGHLQGFRVNRVDGNKLFPAEMPRSLRPRTPLYRNYDQTFERVLSRPTAVRRLGVRWLVSETPEGFALTLTDEDEVSCTCAFAYPHEPARTPQTNNLRTQLSKLGDTPFRAEEVEVNFTANWFIPSSVLSDWRRTLAERLLAARRISYPYSYRALPTEFTRQREKETDSKLFAEALSADSGRSPLQLTYLAGAMNKASRAFYLAQGAEQVSPAFELEEPSGAVLMFCKHCLRYQLGWCVKNGGVRSPFREPFYLVSSDGCRYRLQFDCAQCQMKVYAEEA